MITGIIILFECTNPNFNYRAGVLSARQELAKYFGEKYVLDADEDMPVFAVSCEVTEDDLKKLENKFSSLRLLAIQGDPEKVKSFSEHIIKLS